MGGDPEDPITALAQGAAASHEFFIAMRAAGFSEFQALYITAQVMIAAAGNQGNTGDG